WLSLLNHFNRGHIDELAELALAVADDVEEPLGPREHLLARLDLHDGEPADDLFRLRERAVGHRRLASRATHARVERLARAETLDNEQHTSVDRLLDELAHRLHELRHRRIILGVLVGPEDGNESHDVSSFTQATNEATRDRHGRVFFC